LKFNIFVAQETESHCFPDTVYVVRPVSYKGARWEKLRTALPNTDVISGVYISVNIDVRCQDYAGAVYNWWHARVIVGLC